MANDKYSIREFPGDGATINWPVTFEGGYINATHVKGYTTDADGNIGTVSLTWVDPTTIQVTPAVPVGRTLVLYRDTPKNGPLVTFGDEQILTDTAMNTNARQAVMLAAEAFDRLDGTGSGGGSGGGGGTDWSEQIAGLHASISDEASIREGADYAIANRTQTLEVSMTNVIEANDEHGQQILDLTASVVDEREARIAADTAEALARQTLSVRVDGVETTANNAATKATQAAASVLTEAAARANADNAEALARQNLDARVTTAESALTGVTTRMTAAEAAIQQEAIARANADSAEATLRANLAARVTTTENSIAGQGTRLSTAEAAINTEKTARANGDSANASEITTIKASLTTIGGENLAFNPSFEIGSDAVGTGWIGAGIGTFSLANASFDNNKGKSQSIVGTGFTTTAISDVRSATGYFPVAVAGQTYTLSAYCAATAGLVHRLYIQFRNAAGTVLSTPTSDALTANNSWQRLSVSGVAPAGTAEAILYLRTFGPNTTPMSGTVFWDMVQFEPGGIATGWRDNRGSDYATLQAMITDEKQARIDGDTATASTISGVSAVANSKTRTYRQAAQPTGTFTTGDEWIDTDNGNKRSIWSGTAWVDASDGRFVVLSNSIATTQANVTNEATARANGDSANASAISSVTSTVNGHTASINTLQQSVNGLKLTYSVKLDNNGYVSGVYGNNDGKTSQWVWAAGTFKIQGVGNTVFTPFIVDTVANKVRMTNVEVDTLKVNSVSDDNIIAGSVTNTAYTVITAAQTVNTSSTPTVISVSLPKATKAGSQVKLAGSLWLDPNHGSFFYVDIYRDGTLLHRIDRLQCTTTRTTWPIHWVDQNPPAGTTTYSIRMVIASGSDTSVGFVYRYLDATENKK